MNFKESVRIGIGLGIGMAIANVGVQALFYLIARLLG